MSIPLHFPFPLSLAILGHMVGGSVALLTFLIPLCSRKGSRLHTRTGWIYAGAMLLVACSAFALTTWRFFFDPHRSTDSQAFAVFLFFIALFSVSTLQQGLIVLRNKQRTSVMRTVYTIALPSLLLLASVLLFTFGLSVRKWLFAIFSLLGARVAQRQWHYWNHVPPHPKAWWFFHLEQMFICCIATITAFTVTAVPRIIHLAHADSIGVWLAPTLVMAPWMMWFRRRYEKKFGLTK